MGRLISKGTYDSPAEYATTMTRAKFEIRVKFRLFDENAEDWAKDTIKAIMDEWGWCLQTHPEAVKIEQIPIIVDERVDLRMVVVSLNFDTTWVDSCEIGEWWGEYIEDPALWEDSLYPDYDKEEFLRGLRAQVCKMAESLENVDIKVNEIKVECPMTIDELRGRASKHEDEW